MLKNVRTEVTVMKKKLCALTLTLLLLFAFSANCFAAVSPTGRVLPDKEHQTNGNGGGGYDDDNNKKDNSSTSPKTGMNEIIMVGATAFIITASCVAYVASKKRKEEDEW